MEAAYRKEADCMIVPMPREVDHHVAGNMSREIDLLAESWHVHRIVFDFAGTDFMDSSGIGLIMGRHRTMQEIGGEVIVQNPPPHIRRVLRISGIERIAKIQMDVAGRGKEL